MPFTGKAREKAIARLKVLEAELAEYAQRQKKRERLRVLEAELAELEKRRKIKNFVPEESRLKSAALGAAQGASLGFGEEGAAAVQAQREALGQAGRAIVDPLYAGEHIDPRQILESYRSSRDRYRAGLETAKQAHPYIYGGAEIAGAIAPSLIPGVGEMTLPKMAATGAIQGIGYSEADLTKGDIGGVATDAILGSSIGAGLGVGGKLIGSTGRGLGKIFGRSKLRKFSQERAAKALGYTKRLLKTAWQRRKARETGQVMLNEGVITPRSTPEEMLEKVTDIRNRAGREIGKFLKKDRSKGKIGGLGKDPVTGKDRLMQQVSKQEQGLSKKVSMEIEEKIEKNLNIELDKAKKNLRLQYDDIERSPLQYNVTEMMDKLSSAKDSITSIENQIKDVKNRQNYIKEAIFPAETVETEFKGLNYVDTKGIIKKLERLRPRDFDGRVLRGGDFNIKNSKIDNAINNAKAYGDSIHLEDMEKLKRFAQGNVNWKASDMVISEESEIAEQIARALRFRSESTLKQISRKFGETGELGEEGYNRFLSNKKLLGYAKGALEPLEDIESARFGNKTIGLRDAALGVVGGTAEMTSRGGIPLITPAILGTKKYLDKYGNQMLAKGTQKIAEFEEAAIRPVTSIFEKVRNRFGIDPNYFGRSAKRISDMLKLGEQAFAVRSFVLSSRDPEYRQKIQELQMEESENEEDNEQ